MLTDSSVCLLFLWLLLYVVGKLFLIRELRRIIFQSKFISFSESRYLITNIRPLLFLHLGARLDVYFCSRIYLDEYALMDILWIIIHYYYDLYYLLLLKMSQLWPVGAPSSWLLCPFNKSSLFLSISLLSQTTRCSRLILYFSCPSSGTSRFSKKRGSLLFENISVFLLFMVLLSLVSVACSQPWSENIK